MKKIILSIEGMTCSACSNGLEKYLNKQDGISEASVNLVMANATIVYDEKKVTKDMLDKFVAKAGFKSLGEFKEIKEDGKNKKEKVLIIVFSILAVILMCISMFGMNILNPMLYMSILCIMAIIFIFYGLDILSNGYKNLIHNTPNMDTLVGIGVLASFGYSIYNMFVTHDHMNMYFESSAIVIYFVRLGRYIDGINKDKTKEAIKKLVEITPNNATIKRDGKIMTVTLDQINKGDIVVAKAGDKIAVDGQIVEGTAHLDESFITGESKPSQKGEGDKVLAGSLNYDGYLEYKAERIGKESTVSEIVKLVVEASNTKAPIAKVADKVSSIFVPTVLIIAVCTLIGTYLITKDLNMAVTSFVSVLVVACPCALGLATPLAVITSEGLCAQNGILVKKSEILENAQKVDMVVLDKTGTITYGKLKIAKVINYSNLDEEEILNIVGSVEAKSTHPIATAFEAYNKYEAKDVENIAGMGIKGKVDSKEVHAGNSKILESLGIDNPHFDDAKLLSNEGNSVIYVLIDEKLVALIAVNDIVRDEAQDMINSLKENNIYTIMLTGDNEQTANIIASKVGVDKVIANVLPAQKADFVKELKAQGKHVLMCGDGINDSPSLATADVGVSVNSGTDIAIDSADVILTSNNLNSIINLINISKKTIKNIKQNLFWAFAYNILMIPIAMGLFRPFGIEINPMIGSLAMVLSSITVILNTLRLRRVKMK